MVVPIEEPPKLFVVEHGSRRKATPSRLLLGTLGFPELWEVDHLNRR